MGMERLLITGGTAFVSRYTAAWFQAKGYDVSVLNRGTKEQVPGVRLFQADRNRLGNTLRGESFDWIIDVCGYTREDVQDLLDGVDSFGGYLFISSSAVYPETTPQPFSEVSPIGPNKIWGAYGMGKVEAEQYLSERFPQAYILRPPYLYGPGQNVYREPFVFECALAKRKFYLPKEGKMKLQFFHVEDLCKMMETVMAQHPQERIFNVGNTESTDIGQFVELCYRIVGTPLQTVYVKSGENQRDYFSFYDYEYALDVTRQNRFLPNQKGLLEGLTESFQWYMKHLFEGKRTGYLDFIRKNFEN